MKIYSIVRVGNEYVVQADENRSENREPTKGRPARHRRGGAFGFGKAARNRRGLPPPGHQSPVMPGIKPDPQKFLDNSGRFP